MTPDTKGDSGAEGDSTRALRFGGMYSSSRRCK